MNEATGIVTDSSAGGARVRVDASACPRCRAGGGCGAGIFAGRQRRLSIRVPVAGGLRVQPGDSVRLNLPAGRLLHGVLLLYGLPLAGLLCGAIAAWFAGLGEAMAVISAITGVIAGFAAGAWLARRTPCLSDLRPTISAITTSPDQAS